MKNVSKANMRRNIAMQLQRHAAQNITPTTPGAAVAANSQNNGLGVRVYREQFVKMLSTVFGAMAYYRPFFGEIQTLDDISNNDTAFTIKVNNQPVVPKRYNTDPNVGFGTGTSNSNRFGTLDEIIYKYMSVKYTWDYGWHEGYDRKTVGIDETAVVADRTALIAEFKTREFNQHHGEFISGVATELTTKAAADVPTGPEVVAAFNEAAKTHKNQEVIGVKRAYVSPDVWNLLVDNGLTVQEKNAGVNIADDYIYKFKGYVLTEVPDSGRVENEHAYFTIDGVGVAFTGIETARTIESADFDGRQFQGAARAGEFILDDNKKTVLKFVTTP
ncbi:hypothetical protein EC99P2_00013 [Enterococcus phage EC99P2]|nr:hypothetical protein EC99P2_00013 [Enterococcus phage EC99P2]